MDACKGAMFWLSVKALHEMGIDCLRIIQTFSAKCSQADEMLNLWVPNWASVSWIIRFSESWQLQSPEQDLQQFVSLEIKFQIEKSSFLFSSWCN